MHSIFKTPKLSFPFRTITSYLWLIFAITFTLQVLLPFVQQTMFFDGLIYASSARNMAAGFGSFWRPQFSETLFSLFAEHPPLLLWMESFGFSLFGDSIWVEKTFSLIIALTSCLIFFGIWNRLQDKEKPVKQLVAVPLFLTYVGGRYGWGMGNNMLEGMLIVWTSLAIYCVICAFHSGEEQPWPVRFAYVTGAGIATVLAILTKGPVGLFPLATIGIFGLVYRKPKLSAALLYTVVLIAILVLFFWLVRFHDGARGYMDRYVQNQLYASLTGQRGSDGGGIKAILTLFRLLFFPILICSLLLVTWKSLARRHPDMNRLTAVIGSVQQRNALFFLLVGLSASLPLCISPRIYSFYFNTSIPYFAAALSCLCAPLLPALFSNIEKCKFDAIGWCLFAGLALSISLVLYKIGDEGNDKELIRDSQKIGDYICGPGIKCGMRISACPSMSTNWQFIAYQERQFRISLQGFVDASPEQTHPYLVADSSCVTEVPSNYSEISLGLSYVKLFKKQN